MIFVQVHQNVNLSTFSNQRILEKPWNPLCIEGQFSATREVKWIVAVNAEIPAAFSDGL